MTYQAILAYNESLVRSDSKCDLLRYIKHINSLYEKPIDISFMEELLSSVGQDTCCIPHTLLVKYGAFKEKRDAGHHVKETLELYEFVNGSNKCTHNIERLECLECKYNSDFKVANVRDLGLNGKHYNKNIYYLKPNTFKMILMRSKCERKYARYYILLEEAIKYYHDYQTAYKEYLMSQKDDKIDELTKKIDDQNRKIDELLGYAKSSDNRLAIVEDELEDTIEDLTVVQDKLDIAVVDRAVKPRTRSKINQVAIIKKGNVYNFVCGQKRYVTSTTKDKTVVKLIDNVPNSMYLFDHIKHYFSTKINVVRRDIRLKSINETTFLDSTASLFERKT